MMLTLYLVVMLLSALSAYLLYIGYSEGKIAGSRDVQKDLAEYISQEVD